jgi:transmembrane sensor
VANDRPPLTAAVEADAAAWVARWDAGLTPEARAQFDVWLGEDPRHAAAWQELESAWRAFDEPRRSGDAGRMIGELANRQRRRQRRMMIGSATAALATAAVFVFVVHPFSTEAGPATGGEPAQSVRMALPERRLLADGSVVELNAGAQIEVQFSGAQRAVRFVQGEALFTVAKDAARPFIVNTGFAKVRAVGTAFAVGVRPHAVAVLVTEGTVAVEGAPSGGLAAVPVSSGNALLVPNSLSPDVPLRVESVPPEEIERRLAWRAPRLELSHTALSDVVAAFNRGNRVQLAIADPGLAGLRLSGVFRADRPEDFVRLLESHYGVRADHPGPGRVVLRRAQ